MIFFTLIVANNILTEAALSFLGVGVPPPTRRAGATSSSDGQIVLTRGRRPLAPGIAILLIGRLR